MEQKMTAQQANQIITLLERNNALLDRIVEGLKLARVPNHYRVGG